MVGFLALLAFCGAPGDAETGRARTWADMIDAAKADPALASARAQLIERARKVAGQEVIRRAVKLDDVGKRRTWLDHRADVLEPEIRETFALSMSDFSACSTLSDEMPLLCAAYRLTGEAVFKNRALAQLEEMASWSPLQRPGWTCYEPGRRLPADGKDGAWLGTGLGIRTIADTLDIMPVDAVGADLRTRLEKLLASEIAGIIDDWNSKRTWFVRANNPITNQWVLPTEGLVRACLVLGVKKHKDAYEIGVRNLLAALGSHGPAGEFEEGLSYAEFTVTSMLCAARAMAVDGDRRALDHPFLRSFPTWVVHHLQPGESLINCFDAISMALGFTGRLRPFLSMSLVCTGSEAARWGLSQVGGCSISLPILLARAVPSTPVPSAPLLYAHYQRATRVNWRDSWDDNASGVWVRGGHEKDQHDHSDRGHVNLIFRGKPILIECGTPAYHMKTLGMCQTCAGHNVLQVGDAPALRKPSPIKVERLDATGGDISVDGTACYSGAKRWKRNVTWSSSEMGVIDDVELAEGREELLTFRWHLGTDAEVTIDERGGLFRITWADASMTLTATEDVVVRQEKVPDYTLVHRGWQDDSPKYVHTCIVVRTKAAVGKLTLLTQIAAPDKTRP